MSDAPIGVFDSGVGGLTVARALLDQLPHEQLLYGVARLPDGQRKNDLAQHVEAMISDEFDHRVVAFDETAAAHYADIVVRRERSGRPISAADAQIAATCRSHGAALATRNTDDFTDTGIAVVDPWTQH